MCAHHSAKTLTAVRVAASKMKKIDIDIPKLDQFVPGIHFTARKLYSNVYLNERSISAPATGLLWCAETLA
jgi:hypothetical protein